MKRRVLRPEEQRIWAKVAATVTPRPGRSALPPEPPDRAPAGPQVSPGGGERMGGPSPAGARYGAETMRRAPAALTEQRRVRRGQVEIDGRLDLHGMTQLRARAALGGFLARLRERGGRCGLVITGKGRPPSAPHTESEGGVLRRRLPEWLAEADLAPLVAGYAPAHRRHGGEGAWYVFLKRRGAQRRV